jgi:hypothetical protein
MRKTIKKMVLSRETLRNLESTAIREALGGASIKVVCNSGTATATASACVCGPSTPLCLSLAC